MDAVIRAEASELTCGARYSCADVIVEQGGATVFTPARVTVLFDQLKLIKQSLWANAPNEPQLHYVRI